MNSKMQFFFQLKKGFFKSFATLFLGSALSQVIVFLSFIFLTRLFDESTIGLYLLFSSSLIILKPISTLSLEFSILLPKRDKDAINIVFFSFFYGFILTIILLLIIFILEEFLLNLFSIQHYQSFIYFIPLGLLFINVTETLNYWNNRMGYFKGIASGSVVKSAAMSSYQISSGFFWFKKIGLILGHILGLFTQTFYLYLVSVNSLKKHIKHLSFKRMFFLLKKYKNVPVFNSLLSFSDQLSAELPVILIANFFGFQQVAFYGLASKVLKTPSGLVSQSASQVFFNQAGKIHNNKESLYKLVKSTYKQLLISGILIFSVFFFLSFFLNVIFGDNWEEAELYVRILLPLIFLAYLNSPISSIITILKEQKIILTIDILKLILRFLGIYIGYKFYNSTVIAISIFVTVGVIYNLFIMSYFFYISKKDYREIY